jgi:hypothetical protein
MERVWYKSIAILNTVKEKVDSFFRNRKYNKKAILLLDYPGVLGYVECYYDKGEINPYSLVIVLSSKWGKVDGLTVGTENELKEILIKKLLEFSENIYEIVLTIKTNYEDKDRKKLKIFLKLFKEHFFITDASPLSEVNREELKISWYISTLEKKELSKKVKEFETIFDNKFWKKDYIYEINFK